MMSWLPVIGMVTNSVMVIVVVYLVLQARTRRVEAQVQMQSKLIDRFGSAPELIEFLQSPSGRSFVAGVQAGPAALMRERLLSGSSWAIVLICLGAGFLGLTYFVSENFAVPAAVLFSLGIGFLLATFVSYQLSRRMRAGELDPTLPRP